ncbi:thioesterase II family protein [Amycolatopsis nigrescens]|uniref:thioesterase II family protein n=1 Tax=Amycolatopsis nigrescens TaxID=381445 RepID=UPI00036457BC|nr:alpha/beta fold hydrolase [Amycolatopsis nigrescens]
MTVSAQQRAGWLRNYHPAPDSARLVVFPHAGGSASYYFPLSAALGPAVDVHALQYPGRQDRQAEPPIGDLRELADLVTEVVRPLTGGPLAFFGHSMGATLAFEVASRLERRHGTVLSQLFVSGRRAPSRARAENLHTQDDRALVAELSRLSGTDADLLENEELLSLILPPMRADYRAIETYRWDPATPMLNCAVSALIGDTDPRVDQDDADAWRTHTTGAFDLETYPGGHFYLADQQAEVVRKITGTLRR